MSIGVQPIFRQSATNSSVPNAFGSMLCQARSRTVGRSPRGPTPSRQW